MNPYVSDLALYDIQGTPGVAADISHINSKAKTKVHVHSHPSDSSNLPYNLPAARHLCCMSDSSELKATYCIR